MRPISKKTTKVLKGEERMKKCCLFYLGDCSGKIEWHHNLIYAGKQSDVPETILGICKGHHDMADIKDIKEQIDWQMFKLFNSSHFDMFYKSSLLKRFRYLEFKYGNTI